MAGRRGALANRDETLGRGAVAWLAMLACRSVSDQSWFVPIRSCHDIAPLWNEKDCQSAGESQSIMPRPSITPSPRGDPGPSRILLPRPAFRGMQEVAAALHARRTVRAISARELPAARLSELLWAAFGINRRRGPFGDVGRTAASASNSQEIDLYVALSQGAYLYCPTRHRLIRVATADLRGLALSRGQGALGATAPVRLIYVADLHRLTHTRGFDEPGLHRPAVQRSYYYVDAGLIAANVYLYAAARGLAAWFHNCQRAALFSALSLTAGQRVLFAQTVGYPDGRGAAET